MTLRPVANGLSSPVELAHAGDGSGRLFVVEQAGRIKILKNGAVLATPFLDITALTLGSGERGLLGLAFHPQYASNRRFYVFYTRRSDGALRVSEFQASAANADVADATSERPIITIAHADFGNHNGGRIAFGPDGYLYIGTGDGGSGGDPDDNGQNKNALLGKLLRIDVNATTGYVIPPGNPFVAADGADEVWAYGLRNPWKFSFDRATGDLFIADVGQNAWEEISFEPAGSGGGRNYGWDEMEGAHCFEPSSGCNTAGKVLPIIEYSHQATGGTAVIGGYVYRGTRSASLRGFYVYGDLNLVGLRAASRNADGTWSTFPLVNGPGTLTAFGEDEAGELYVVGYGGTVHAIDGPDEPVPARARGDLDGDGRADVVWRNASSGENYAYLMNGRVIQGEGYLRTVEEQAWKVAGIGDFDGDGKADLLWRNTSTGQNYIWFMDGTAIKLSEGSIRSVADQSWTVAGVGDFNGDGKDDILWRNVSTGQNYIYFMDGRSILEAEGYVRTVALEWKIAGVGDADGDGRADIVWRNTATGENYLYPMLGRAIKPNEGYLRTVAEQSWQIAGIGDFDADGMADLLWRNASSGENYLYFMNGRQIRAEGYLRTVADPSWTIAQVGDFDGDGKSDLLWRNTSTGENYLYPLDGKTIKPGEGFVRTVPPGSWHIAK